MNIAGADEYFNRSARVAAHAGRADRLVRYAVFARKAGVLSGLDRAMEYVRSSSGPSLLLAEALIILILLAATALAKPRLVSS